MNPVRFAWFFWTPPALALLRFFGCGLIALALGGALSPAEAQNGPELRLVVLGDSLTAGYGLGAADAFPARLEAALRVRGHAVRVINAGVSGDTTAGGRARLEWVLGDRPHGMIIALGANDGLRGLAPEATRRHLDHILARLRAHGVPVLLAGMKAPRNLGASYVRAFDALYPELARRHDTVFYPFFLDGVALVPALNQRDGIHPNAAGVGRMVSGIMAAVETLLSRMKGPRTRRPQ